MRLLRLFGGLLGALVLGGCVYTRPLLHEMRAVESPADPARLTWEVTNRHRLLASAAEQARFEADLAAYIEEYRHWHKAEETVGAFANIRDTDLLHGQEGVRMPRNYEVNYDPGTNSYRCRDAASPLCRGSGQDWIADRARSVRLRFGGERRRCEWTIDGRREAGACDRDLSTVVDQRREVSVVRLDDGATGQTVVQARDLTILALGDSFSAGEGNPHIQWRAGRHPAAWLDARCHRSLMSGPALTAAALARSNPHVSVTLLHYGCSGASVADGLVTPWSQLETTADIRAQYAAFDIRGEAFEELRVATARPQIHDVPLSQVEQALADLTVDGRLIEPDFILVSIGGNDIGFASIVSALAARGSTVPDLRADLGPNGVEQVVDWRPYAPFDHVSWVQAARDAPCLGLDPVECMARRIAGRISGAPADPDRPVLDRQYDALAEALAQLTAGRSERVFITHYPNFVMREPDGVPAGQAHPDQAVGCHDEPGDGRPGFVPGVLAWLPDVGMDGAASTQAGERFLRPLNTAIDRAAQRHGWNVVSTHVRNGATHGYCSHHRYYNTLVDSYYDQGRRYETGRPLGNIVILRPDNVFNLPVGSRVIWDAARGCFTPFPERDACLPAPRTLPVLELRREIEEGATYAQMIADTSSRGTTGPVHPNLFGHCNYASAILTSLVARRDDIPFGEALERDAREAGEDGLQAAWVCRPESWGYTHAHQPHPADWQP